MATINKPQRFHIGDFVRHSEGDGRLYKVLEAKYVYYPHGEDWEYTLQDMNTGATKQELDSPTLVLVEPDTQASPVDRKKNKNKKK